MYTTRVWVARDSTNQPLRNSLWLAWRSCSITKEEGQEVEDRADGAEPCAAPVVQGIRRLSLSGGITTSPARRSTAKPHHEADCAACHQLAPR
jgi:hypothetical protein